MGRQSDLFRGRTRTVQIETGTKSLRFDRQRKSRRGWVTQETLLFKASYRGSPPCRCFTPVLHQPITGEERTATPAEIACFFNAGFYTNDVGRLSRIKLREWLAGGNDAVFGKREAPQIAND